MQKDQIELEYRLTHGENGEIIDSAEEMAINFAYNELLLFEHELPALIDKYKNIHGENGSIIDWSEEVALTFVYNQFKTH